MAKDKQKQYTQDDADLLTVLQIPQGRRLLTRIMGWANIDSNPFHINPNVMSYNDGRRSLGLQLKYEICAIDPKQYILMLTEGLTAASVRATVTPGKTQNYDESSSGGEPGEEEQQEQ